MQSKIAAGLIGLAVLSFGAAAHADPAAEQQARDLIKQHFSENNPTYTQVKSDKTDSSVVCGYVTLEQLGGASQRRFLYDGNSSNLWVEKQTGTDSRSIDANDREYTPKWRACHK